MLVKLKQIDFESFIDKAYEMAIVPEYTSYPIYYDGIKTRENYISVQKNLLREKMKKYFYFFMIINFVVGFIIFILSKIIIFKQFRCLLVTILSIC